MTKEQDAFDGAQMFFDLPTLLYRTVKNYDEDDLTMKGRETIQGVKEFLDAFKKHCGRFEGYMMDLIEMSGVDMDVEGYDD